MLCWSVSVTVFELVCFFVSLFLCFSGCLVCLCFLLVMFLVMMSFPSLFFHFVDFSSYSSSFLSRSTKYSLISNHFQSRALFSKSDLNTIKKE